MKKMVIQWNAHNIIQQNLYKLITEFTNTSWRNHQGISKCFLWRSRLWITLQLFSKFQRWRVQQVFCHSFYSAAIWMSIFCLSPAKPVCPGFHSLILRLPELWIAMGTKWGKRAREVCVSVWRGLVLYCKSTKVWHMHCIRQYSTIP